MDTQFEGGSKGDPVQITEDEAAVYDRQIRLWGLEAQQRMRNATILVIRLRGTATEAIKNIVLAGIGKLVIYDSEEVKEEDLGAGFFFRDEDVGKKRVDAAKARIEALNPLVTVQALRHPTILEQDSLEALIMSVDLVCVTDWDREALIKINDICRQFGKPFYAGGTFGLLGYVFCDLLKHDYISPDRSAPKEAPKNVKATASYPRLSMALQHRWTGLTKRQTKELNPAVVHMILALWEYQHNHEGRLPDDMDTASELGQIANSILATSDVNRQVLTSVPLDLIDAMSTSAAHEFSPTCAVVGGILAQDILKALAAREAPIANFFTFDGNTGGGSVCRMNM
jgi:ubiquitin-like 1-activating enzyme E1 A